MVWNKDFYRNIKNKNPINTPDSMPPGGCVLTVLLTGMVMNTYKITKQTAAPISDSAQVYGQRPPFSRFMISGSSI
jgi:hypothetical protein